LQPPVTRKPKRPPAPELAIDPDALPPSASIEDRGLRAALLRLGSGARRKLTSA